MALPTKTKLKPYIALIKTKTQLEQKLADVKARLTKLEPEIAEAFISEGIQSHNMDGYTLYLNRQIWAGADGNKEKMMLALKFYPDDSWSFMVKDSVNSQTLSARVRECERDKDDMPILPEALKSVIKIAEVFRIGARKASSRKEP